MKSNFKTTVKLFLTGVMFTALSAFASESNLKKEERKAEAEISNTIRNQISFPEFLLNQKADEFFAEVAFKISENGQLLVTDVKAENEELTEEVKRQLSNIRLVETKESNNGTYRIVLRFRAL